MGTGLRDVKARGGVSIVREPNQAENPGMPLQAIKEDAPKEDAPDYRLRIAEIGPNRPIECSVDFARLRCGPPRL